MAELNIKCEIIAIGIWALSCHPKSKGSIKIEDKEGGGGGWRVGINHAIQSVCVGVLFPSNPSCSLPPVTLSLHGVCDLDETGNVGTSLERWEELTVLRVLSTDSVTVVVAVLHDVLEFCVNGG